MESRWRLGSWRHRWMSLVLISWISKEGCQIHLTLSLRSDKECSKDRQTALETSLKSGTALTCSRSKNSLSTLIWTSIERKQEKCTRKRNRNPKETTKNSRKRSKRIPDSQNQRNPAQSKQSPNRRVSSPMSSKIEISLMWGTWATLQFLICGWGRNSKCCRCLKCLPQKIKDRKEIWRMKDRWIRKWWAISWRILRLK